MVAPRVSGGEIRLNMVAFHSARRMSLPVVFHPDYVTPLRPGHRFPMSKYGYLRRHLIDAGLMEQRSYLSPAEAGVGLLALAHAPDYVDKVLGKTLGEKEIRAIGLPMTEKLIRRVRLSSAGTLLAARLAMEHGVACNGAGGSHHAAHAAGSGYCVFNDVAVAAAALVSEGAANKVLVIDLDVHQGDGTAQIFARQPAVFTLSVHAEKNFPARKKPSNLDAPLPDGTDDAAYLQALAAALEQAEGVISPDIIFYNAGVDVHRDDRLGRLSLTDNGVAARDAYVMHWARGRGAPLVGVLGGGYGDDPSVIAARHVSLFEQAAKLA